MRDMDTAAIQPGKTARAVFWLRCFLPYLVLIVLPVVLVSLFFYSSVRGTIEDQITESSQIRLDSARDQIEQIVDDLANINTMLVQNDYLRATSPDNPYGYYEASQQMRMFLKANANINAIYYYLVDEGMLLSTQGNYRLDTGYSEITGTGLTPEQLTRSMTASDMPFTQGIGNHLFFFFPSGTFRYFGSYVVAFQLPKARFLAMIRGDSDIAFIQDRNGETIVSTAPADAPPIDPDDQSLLVISTQSDATGWHLYHVYDRDIAMAEVYRTERAALLVTITITLLGLLILLHTIRSVFKPLSRIRENVERLGAQPGINSLQSLALRMDDVQAFTRELRRVSDINISMLKQQLFLGILRGQIVEPSEFWDIARHLSGDSPCQTFRLVMVRIGLSHQDAEGVLEGASDVLKQRLFPESNIISLSTHTEEAEICAYVLNGDLHSDQEMMHDASLALDELERGIGPDSSMVMTGVLPSLELVRKSYYVGVEILADGKCGEIRRINPDRYDADGQLARGLAQLRRLSALLDAGKVDEAKQLFEDFFQGFETKAIRPAYVKYLCYDAIMSILRTQRSASSAGGNRMIISLESGDMRAFKEAAEAALEAQRGNASQQPDEADEFIAGVARYVAENLSDPNLGIGDIAEHLGYSYKYTSHQFREKTGVRLSEYISRARQPF